MGNDQPRSKNNSKVETGSGDDTVVIICNIFIFKFNLIQEFLRIQLFFDILLHFHCFLNKEY